jgi:hypothetical protein
MVFSPLVGSAHSGREGIAARMRSGASGHDRLADTSLWLELPMATMQHPIQRTVMGDIEPGAKPTAVVPAPPVWASGRG